MLQTLLMTNFIWFNPYFLTLSAISPPLIWISIMLAFFSCSLKSLGWVWHRTRIATQYFVIWRIGWLWVIIWNYNRNNIIKLLFYCNSESWLFYDVCVSFPFTKLNCTKALQQVIGYIKQLVNRQWIISVPILRPWISWIISRIWYWKWFFKSILMIFVFTYWMN